MQGSVVGRKLGLLSGLVLFVSSGCLSTTAMQQALAERDAEIQNLRDERSQLKLELEQVSAEKADLQASMQEATMKLALKSVATSASSQPEQEQRAPASVRYDDLDVPVEMRDGKLVITLPSAIAFSSGSATLTSNGASVLGKVAAHLKKDYPSATFYIEGHTDSDPISKSAFESNRALSLARAMSVLKHLVESCQIPDEQFVVVGHGQYQPIASNSSADNKAKNRRVEIVVHAAGR